MSCGVRAAEVTMKKHCKTRHCLVLLALLTSCSLGFVAGAKPEKLRGHAEEKRSD